MINRFCHALAYVLSKFKIIDFNKLLNAPDKRTDAEKIKHDFNKALDKYQKKELVKTNSLFLERFKHVLTYFTINQHIANDFCHIYCGIKSQNKPHFH